MSHFWAYSVVSLTTPFALLFLLCALYYGYASGELIEVGCRAGWWEEGQYSMGPHPVPYLAVEKLRHLANLSHYLGQAKLTTRVWLPLGYISVNVFWDVTTSQCSSCKIWIWKIVWKTVSSSYSNYHLSIWKCCRTQFTQLKQSSKYFQLLQKIM